MRAGEAYACALGDIYTFGPTFRAENSNTSRHLAEFWMIEPEMAFCDLDGDRALAEEFLRYVIATVIDQCAADLEFFTKRIDETVLPTLLNVAESDFAHITYTEAVQLLEKAGRDWEFPVFWGADLQSEHERYLTEEVFRRPVVVTDYPKEIKAFYMRLNDDGRYGTVPHAGFGLGFERTIAYATGLGNVRDCIPFPRTPNNCAF